MTTNDIKKTITMTGRAPIRITIADWPVIAQASGRNGDDCHTGAQSYMQGQASKWGLKVRQHADGRVIVAAWAEVGQWTSDPMVDGGCLLPDGSGIPEAIAQVGEDCGIPPSTVRECIADLPAEEV